MSRALTITQISGKSKKRTSSEKKRGPKGAVKNSVIHFEKQANDSVSVSQCFVLRFLVYTKILALVMTTISVYASYI